MSDDDEEITFTPEDGFLDAGDDSDPHVVYAEDGTIVLFPFGLAFYAEQKELDMVTIDPVGGVWHHKDGEILPSGELKKKLKSVN